VALPTPQFFLARDPGNPFRGFIRPTLRVTGIKTQKGMGTSFSLQTPAAKVISGWADEVSSGTYPDRGNKLTRFSKKSSALLSIKTRRGELEKLQGGYIGYIVSDFLDLT